MTKLLEAISKNEALYIVFSRISGLSRYIVNQEEKGAVLIEEV